ncbi:MAG: hypothetical protein OMM_10659, partial [Candidatus Magnetoglobus multicellularis str. Araruama]
MITSEKITDESIQSSDLAPGSIDYTRLSDAIITTSKLVGSGGTSITNGTVNQILSSNGDGTFSWVEISSDLDNGSITSSKLASSGNTAMTSGVGGQSLVSNGDGTFSWANISASSTIPDGSITEQKLSLTHLTASTLTLSQSLTANTVQVNNDLNINNTSLTSLATQNRTVTFTDASGIVVISADGKISTSELNDNAVTSEKIADGTISYTQIADNAITTNKIADNAITTSKIEGSSNTNQVLVTDSFGNS